MLKVATQAQTNAGTADDVAVTPKKLRAGFAISLGATNYISFPTWLGGWIIQFGTATGTASVSSGSTTVTWPIPFPLECRVAFFIDAAGSAPTLNTMGTGNLTVSDGIAWWRVDAGGTSGVGQFYFLSIGN